MDLALQFYTVRKYGKRDLRKTLDKVNSLGIENLEMTRIALTERNGKYYLENISAPTIPLQAFPKLCYLYTPRSSNFKYGVAAATFAAIEYDKMMRDSN